MNVFEILFLAYITLMTIHVGIDWRYRRKIILIQDQYDHDAKVLRANWKTAKEETDMYRRMWRDVTERSLKPTIDDAAKEGR